MANIEEVYLFTGTEEVRKRNKLERLLSNFDLEETSVTKYDAELTSIQEIIADCMTIPFLAEQKVIIVKNPLFLTTQKTSIKHDVKMFVDYIKKPTDTTVLIIDAVGHKLSKDNEAYRILQKKAYIIDTQELDDVEYKAWIIRSFAKEKVEIKEDALVMLMEYVNKNLVRMENEIIKLSDYVGAGGKISTKEIEMLVPRDLESDVYTLIKALIAKNKSEALRIYHDMSQNTQDIVGIMSLVGKTFKDFLTVAKMLKSGFNQSDIATTFGYSNGRAYYLVKDAKSFKLEVLEKYVVSLAELDYNIKTGKVNPQLAMELLILENI